MSTMLEELRKKQKEKAAENSTQYQSSKKYDIDERFYVLSKDQQGNSKVKIRLVPSLNSTKDDLRFFTVQKVHAVNWNKNPLDSKSEKRYFSCVCPKTVDKENYCPLCDYGWTEANKIERVTGDAAKTDPQQILRSKYLKEFTNNDKIITNILIVKDDINPDNNGKVFLYELKSSIFKLLQSEIEAVADEIADCGDDESSRKERGLPLELEAFDPYNIELGKDLWLIYKDKKNHPDQDPKHYWGSSRWDNVYTDKTKGNPEIWQAIVESAYCLDEFTSESVLVDTDMLEQKVKYLTFNDNKKESSKKDSNTTETKTAEEKPKVEEPKTTISDDDIEAIINTETKVEETVIYDEPVAETKVEDKPKVETPKVESKTVENEIDDVLADLLNS